MYQVIPHEYAGSSRVAGIMSMRGTNMSMMKDLTNTSGWQQNLD